MKKAVIIASAAVLLTGAAFIFKISKNSDPIAETSMVMSDDSGTYIVAKKMIMRSFK